jgi:putative copper resistance protein D
MSGLVATLAAPGGGLLPAHGGGPGDLPALTWSQLFAGWSVEWLPLITIAITAGVYLSGVVVLRRRGDAWSPWRTVSFVGGGMGTLLIATQSALAAYDLTLLSAHMVQHMLLSMLAPIFMALGAPVTLALRTLPARGRGWLLAFLHSRFARVLTYPLVAGFLFIANPFVLYFTPLYEATLRHPWVHEWNHLHFVVVGCLWFFLIIGVDPLPNRMSYPMRMLAVFVTMPFHAFLGVTIMSANGLIAENWYTALERTWGVSPLADQRLAGGIIWGSGELVSLVVILALFVQWARDSDREARREDRRLDRLEAEARSTGESGLPDNGLWWESGRR